MRNPELVEHLVLEGPAGLRDEGTGGVPADPEGRMRALYSNPAHAPPETRSPQVLADTQRVRDGYVGGIDYDKALHDALPGIRARTLIVMGTSDTVVPVITAHRIEGRHRERASELHLRRRACARVRRAGAGRAAGRRFPRTRRGVRGAES